MSWNPRFVAYARAHNRTPEGMLAHDERRWPGGKMTGFMLWVQGHWKTWREERGVPWDYPLLQVDHDDFDKMIGVIL